MVPDVEPFKRIFLPEATAKCSEEVHASVASIQLNVLSVVPLRVIPPPSAPASVGDATDPNSIFLSSTEIVVEFIVVVVPLTVKFPVTVKDVAVAAPMVVIFVEPAHVDNAVSSTLPKPTFDLLMVNQVGSL